MSELEELPSWAGRSTEDPQPDQATVLGREATTTAPIQVEEEERRRRPWLVALLAVLGLAALLGMGALGYFLADSQDSNETAAEQSNDGAADESTDGSQLGSEVSTDDAGDDDATATGDADGDATASDADGDDAVTVDVADDDASTDGSGSTDADTDGAADADTDGNTDGDGTAGDADADGTTEGTDSGRRAAFRGGKLYLSGPVPSEEISQIIEQTAAAVVGPENVVNEYVIDPDTVIVPGSSTPLIVEDVVLFEFNSIAIAPPFLPILDLGTLLLRQNPQATVTVITRTDAVGSEEVNLDVSTKRAQAVIDYWLSKGVDRDQIIADPRGEEGASEDDDEETAALNRRAEFVITGILD